jgi:1-pyrroline-5-carboxylate dehydrogenase
MKATGFMPASVVQLPFQNLNTYVRLAKENKADEFHANFERAVGAMYAAAHDTVISYPMFINGEVIPAKALFDDASPIDPRLILGRFPKCTKADVDKAVAAAESAFQEWSSIPYQKKAEIFHRAAEIMAKELYRFAAAITLDNGKNRDEAVGEVDEAVDFLEFYSQTIIENQGFRERKNPPYDDEDPVSVMLPYGVFAVICPFNFPLSISVGMTSAALITGNTVVVKPASVAPLAVYLFYDLLVRAGLPAGVMNVVTGSGAEVGDHLVNHAKVAGIVFTGSKEVGFRLLRSNPRSWSIPIIAEMGGKNACIVSDKADIDKAAEGVLHAAFGFSGQKCSACSRVYVQEEISDTFISKLVSLTKDLKVCDPRLKECDLGPVIHPKAVSDYEKYAAMAKKDGKVLFGGNTLKDQHKGYYVEPTIVVDLPDDHYLVRNELFMPFLVVQKYSVLPEALAKANGVEYGLTSGIYSQDLNEIEFFFDHIQAGVAYANRARGATTGAMVGGQPFGGWKASSSTGKGSGTKEYLLQFVRQQARTTMRP